MRRIDKNPTNNNLIELLKADPISRNSDLRDLIEILPSFEHGATIFLNGDWGAGKTFFVKQLKLMIEAMDPAIKSDEDVADALKRISAFSDLYIADSTTENAESQQRNEKQSVTFLPIYYNAWENDYWDDPLPSLIQKIAWESEGAGDVDANTVVDKFAGIADAILKPFNLDVLKEVKVSFDGTKLLRDYEDRLKIRSKVKELIAMALNHKADKLLLIIDELDRCKPTFALRLLEEVKTLFDAPNLIVLYSVNVAELSKTTEGEYGSGFDGSRYLSRFYDVEYCLRVPASGAYFAHVGTPNDSYRSHEIAHELVRALGMSLRDQNRYQIELERIGNSRPGNRDGQSIVAAFAEDALATLLLALKVVRPLDYNEFVGLRSLDKLMEYAAMSDGMLDYIDTIIGDRRNALIRLYPEAQNLFPYDSAMHSGGVSAEAVSGTLLQDIRDTARKIIVENMMVLLFEGDSYSNRREKARDLFRSGFFNEHSLIFLRQKLAH